VIARVWRGVTRAEDAEDYLHVTDRDVDVQLPG